MFDRHRRPTQCRLIVQMNFEGLQRGRFCYHLMLGLHGFRLRPATPILFVQKHNTRNLLK
jgi:hypothetical protein